MVQISGCTDTGLGERLKCCAELAEDETSLTVANDLTVRRALEAAGVIDENGSAGPGVTGHRFAG